MLLNENKKILKISDLGTAKTPSNGGQLNNNSNGEYDCTFEHGTPGYRAPEITNEEKYTNSIDVFSLGRSLWQLLYKRYVDLLIRTF